MRHRRVASLIMLAVLLAVNFFTLLWLQGRPISTAWASALSQATSAKTTGATIPATFNYQGFLRNPDGTLMTGTHKIVVRLYADPADGNPLHDETFANVPVREGLFNIVLGDAVPFAADLFLNHAPLYLGVTLDDGQELIPRQRIHAVPWALTASSLAPNASANGLTNNGTTALNNGLTVGGDTTLGGGLTVNQDLTVNQNLTVKAIRDIGDSQGGVTHTSSDLSLRRYTVEMKDDRPNMTPMNNPMLTQFCADEDGCSISIGMRDWDAARPGLITTKGPYHFSIGNVKGGKRAWRIDGPNITPPNTLNVATTLDGVDGDNTGEVVLSAWDCVFGDAGIGEISDERLGFGMGATAGQYVSPNTTCVLTIED